MLRSETDVWLIGQPTHCLTGSKLPSNCEVLRRFVHAHTLEKTLHEAAKVVMEETFVFWRKARIPTMELKNGARKLLNLYSKWQDLQRSKKRIGGAHEKNVKSFKESLNNLFDVAAAKALDHVTNHEDRKFLMAQREPGRRGSMGGVDATLASMEARREAREKSQHRRKEKCEQQRADASTTMTFCSSDSSASSSSSDEFSQPPNCSRRRLHKTFTPELASTFDRTRVSNRAAVLVLQASSRSFGHNAEVTPSRETIRRWRMKNRTEIAREIRASFEANVPLTVHWDGKIVQEWSGEKVDRLAILVSGHGVEKLLATPKLQHGTGQAQADAVLKTLAYWDIEDRIVGLSFDTTASNTGKSGGACVLIERALDRHLLNLACRHHIMELVADKVFVECFGPSSGPNIQLFLRLTERWNFINTSDFNSITVEDAVPRLQKSRAELTTEFQSHIYEGQPRDDYRELLELAIITLGSVPQRGVRFMRPGALHRGRWMAKIIYVLKIYLFRSQLSLTIREKKEIRRFVNFALFMYIPAWFAAPVAAAAPRNDLCFLRKMEDYATHVDKSVGEAASTVFKRHLWYLSQHLVSLALFDDGTTSNVKSMMITAMKNVTGPENPCKRTNLQLEDLKTKTLADFCSSSSFFLFDRLGIKPDFLESDPSTWESNEDYMAGNRLVSSLSVVNDRAERGVALMQRYNQALTKDEDQREYLLQVVEKHRKDFSLS